MPKACHVAKSLSSGLSFIPVPGPALVARIILRVRVFEAQRVSWKNEVPIRSDGMCEAIASTGVGRAADRIHKIAAITDDTEDSGHSGLAEDLDELVTDGAHAAYPVEDAYRRFTPALHRFA